MGYKNVLIDSNAGFCFGVVSAISIAEKELATNNPVYCIGDIVHNEEELQRLNSLGLKIVSVADFSSLSKEKVLIRAHGEPPSTYQKAKNHQVKLIDATCPIVLKLQKSIREGYLEMKKKGGQLLIFGGEKHAEVIGLCGQTENTALVITDKNDLDKVDFNKPIRLYAQTTKSKEDYEAIKEAIKERLVAPNADFIAYQTTCKQVSNRTQELLSFSNMVDVILFVSGEKSSNGKYLYQYCKSIFERTYWITTIEDINEEYLLGAKNIGITGATSTPMWLLEEVKEFIQNQ